MKERMIVLANVSKAFGDIKAVDGLNFHVNKGEILGLLGPNGSGKTTTIRLINGVIFPDEGEIKVLGLDTVKDGNEIRSTTGVVTESAGLYENMTAQANLEFFGRIYGLSNQDLSGRINRLLGQFGLEDRRNSKVSRFSTGMKKRLSIARALLHKPEILFLDEPTTGLDPESSRDVLTYIKRLNREEGITILVCTHNLPEAEGLCNRYIFLDSGRIIEQGRLEDMIEKYTTSVQMEIQFSGTLGDTLSGASSYELKPSGRVLVTLEDRKQVPKFLRRLANKVDIYSVNMLNNNLEQLYFEVRRAFYEKTGNGGHN
ncbi:MAG TPA: ABC transporter ATP-binding protein [Clostridiales bacterium]|nr:ABC transporter ATP-binding protein [Clostridiales bacterium]